MNTQISSSMLHIADTVFSNCELTIVICELNLTGLISYCSEYTKFYILFDCNPNIWFSATINTSIFYITLISSEYVKHCLWVDQYMVKA